LQSAAIAVASASVRAQAQVIEKPKRVPAAAATISAAQHTALVEAVKNANSDAPGGSLRAIYRIWIP
jgi:hypothetical protein